MSVSIIIPLLNEADNITCLVNHITGLNPPPLQVILVDGGSNDDSVIIAETLITDWQETSAMRLTIDWQLICSPTGRAQQMNTGASIAAGDILLFLHADTRLPNHAVAEVGQAMTRFEWGRFDVRLDSCHPLLKIVSTMINQRSRWTRIATGDQAIFIKRSVFEAIGGYADLPLMEDVELCKRLKKTSQPACLTSKVITSARRWQRHGMWRTIFLMWHLRFDYWRGVSAKTLKQRYYKS